MTCQKMVGKLKYKPLIFQPYKCNITQQSKQIAKPKILKTTKNVNKPIALNKEQTLLISHVYMP